MNSVSTALAYVDDAIIFATRAHSTQTNQSGMPYILHPLSVMRRAYDYCLREKLDPEHYMQVAVLHDVVEDTDTTVGHIAASFGWDVAFDVDALSRRSEETYKEFILRVKTRSVACAIKRLDIADNLDLSETHPLPEPKGSGLRKRYLEALEELDRK